MEKVSINDLKKNLSYWTKRASQGSVIWVTKHNRPYVCLTRIEDKKGVRVGKNAGSGTVKPVLTDPTNGQWLRILLEDRHED